MSALATHRTCGKRWTQRGNRTSHCADCHETFATLTLFDAHRQGDWTERHCVTPDGLIRDDEGVWWTPEGLANLARLVERGAALPRHADSGLHTKARTPEQPAPAPIPTPADSEPSQRRYVDPEETPR